MNQPRWTVRQARPEDIPGIIALCEAVYPGTPPWRAEQLASHQQVFPEGQLVAVDRETGEVVGAAASLVVLWDEYAMKDSWRDFTEGGYFTNHDLEHGRTLYGAEVMVLPGLQGKGIGKMLYAGRRDLVHRLRLLRIRAGARLRGYHRYADRMTPEEYVAAVARRDLTDPTLSFQLSQGFRVLDVVSDYLRHDPDSRGYAAAIEWVNPDVARPDPAPDRARHRAR